MKRTSGIAARIAARFVPTFGRTSVTCTACGRERADVSKMVAGPKLYICDRCIEQASQQLAPRRLPQVGVQCRFCGQLRANEDVTAVGGVTVCADCLSTLQAILLEATQPSRPAT
jgi:hypothetical protein